MKKIALITGATTGIGRATALRLARDGFAIIVNYLNQGKEIHETEQELKKLKATYHCIQADITREKDVHKMFKVIQKTFGIIDVLVNNAGINQTKSFTNLKPSDVQKIMDVNLLGAFTVTSTTLPLMRRSASPRIIFISSLNSFVGSKNRSVYSASKSALLGLSRALSIELAPQFLVNTIAPGYIDTDMLKKFSQKPLSEKVKRIPLQRFGSPEEVADLVTFLASDKSSYITGQCIHINGGLYSN